MEIEKGEGTGGQEKRSEDRVTGIGKRNNYNIHNKKKSDKP
jgi:hypothetical protein